VPTLSTPTRSDRRPLTGYTVAWYAVMLACCFGPVLWAMFYQWQNDEDVGHGLFVPLIAGYLFWERREIWRGADIAWNPWGIALVGWGALQLWFGTIGAEIFLQRTAFLITLTGILLFYGGTSVLRQLAFPLFLLLFMIPLPGILYKQITFPLQLLASRVAESTIEMLGFMVIREGNVLELTGRQISVVEACSGLRALHSLSFFSLSYACLFDQRQWIRWFLLLCTVPVAVVSNAARIVLTAVVGEYRPELAEGVYHTASGWFLFVFALGLLVGIQKLTTLRLDRMPSVQPATGEYQ